MFISCISINWLTSNHLNFKFNVNIKLKYHINKENNLQQLINFSTTEKTRHLNLRKTDIKNILV